ncbi:MAG: hypothetical protein WDN24_13255 [Sphingomonas sp.]
MATIAMAKYINIAPSRRRDHGRHPFAQECRAQPRVQHVRDAEIGRGQIYAERTDQNVIGVLLHSDRADQHRHQRETPDDSEQGVDQAKKDIKLGSHGHRLLFPCAAVGAGRHPVGRAPPIRAASGAHPMPESIVPAGLARVAWMGMR